MCMCVCVNVCACVYMNVPFHTMQSNCKTIQNNAINILHCVEWPYSLITLCGMVLQFDHIVWNSLTV